MRTPFLLVTVVLMTTAPIMANMAPPLRVDKVVIVELPDDDVEWFHGDGVVGRQPLGRVRSYRYESPPKWYPSTNNYHHGFRLYATDRSGRVRESEFVIADWEEHPTDYLQKEIRYRAELTPTGIELHKVSERVLPTRNETMVWAAAISAAIGVVGWLVMKRWKKQKLATAPSKE